MRTLRLGERQRNIAGHRCQAKQMSSSPGDDSRQKQGDGVVLPGIAVDDYRTCGQSSPGPRTSASVPANAALIKFDNDPAKTAFMPNCVRSDRVSQGTSTPRAAQQRSRTDDRLAKPHSDDSRPPRRFAGLIPARYSSRCRETRRTHSGSASRRTRRPRPQLHPTAR